MKYIILPSQEQERLVYYLAAEEYVASELREGFFLWQSRPTVIYGRNQDPRVEVNIPYCDAHGIEYYRRKSGGGCVYSDPGNIMLSFVTPGTDVEAIFSRYLDTLAGALKSLGLPVVVTTHNDILVDGRKVSGNAYFSTGGVGIVHGTLLYDEDFAAMSASITPSVQKLQSHGVQSVRQRCANLTELGLKISAQELLAHLKEAFSQGEFQLGDDADVRIREIEAGYLDPEFIRGRFL